MKLLGVTYGTEGDTRPLVMLCRALLDAGHDVTLLADGATLDSAVVHAVPHAPLGEPIRDEVVALVERGNGLLASASGLARMARRQTDDWVARIHAAAEGCDAILAGGLAALAALAVAAHRGIPCIGLGMIPITPSRAFPSTFLPPGWIPPGLNKASHHLVTRLIWLQFRAPLRRACIRVLGAPQPIRPWAGQAMLYGFSRHLLPPPADWPDNAVVCGQWTEPAQQWSPPSELAAFLAAGPPPIHIGFGSMVGFDRERVFGALLDGTHGRRVLLSPGWAGLPSRRLPDTVFVVGNVPHQALFPHTSMVIHHGGSGTTHSACRAGVPSVVMPCAADQFFWADRLRRLGVAPHALSHRRLDAATVAAAVSVADAPQARARSTALGAHMAQENGAATAVAAINRLLRPPVAAD